MVHFGGMDVQFFWMPYSELGSYEALKKELTGVFQDGSMGDLYQRLLKNFNGSTHQLEDLFLDEQRKIVEDTLKDRVKICRSNRTTVRPGSCPVRRLPP